MNFGYYVGRAEKALSRVSGVQETNVNLAAQTARVASDDASVIVSVLEGAGHPTEAEVYRFSVGKMSCASGGWSVW